MKKILYSTAIALAATLAIIAVSRTSVRAAADDKAPVEVKIDNFTFAPDPLTVPAGTQVTWTNHDDIPHTVVQNDKLFRSKALDTSDKFTYTFDKPGTYSYFCSIHPKMTGKIIVK